MKTQTIQEAYCNQFKQKNVFSSAMRLVVAKGWQSLKALGRATTGDSFVIAAFLGS